VWAHADNREHARAARRAHDVPLAQPWRFADVTAVADLPHAVLRARLQAPLRVFTRPSRRIARFLPLRDQHTA
jgi:hypothetical protein